MTEPTTNPTECMFCEMDITPEEYDDIGYLVQIEDGQIAFICQECADEHAQTINEGLE